MVVQYRVQGVGVVERLVERAGLVDAVAVAVVWERLVRLSVDIDRIARAVGHRDLSGRGWRRRRRRRRDLGLA